MKRNGIFILAAMLAMSAPLTSNAQVNLKGLKDKAKQTVKSAVNNNAPGKKPMSLEEEHALQDKAKMAARMAALNDEQKWALDQLEHLTEYRKDQPDIPKLIDYYWIEDMRKQGKQDQITPIRDFVEQLGSYDVETINKFKRMIDSRMATYNYRIIDIVKNLPERIEEYDPDYKLRPNLKILDKQVALFEELQEEVDKGLALKFMELKTTTDANGNIKVAKGAWLSPIVGAGAGVALDPKDSKFKFAHYPAEFTYVPENDLAKHQKGLVWLKNCATILSGSDVAKSSKSFAKCDLACTILQQAIANNSKDNIKYISRPAGSALNTPQLRSEALKVLQKRFPTAGYSEVIITGDHWVEVQNVLGIVVERYIDVAAICDGGIAKELVWFTLGNDKYSNGWGPLHFYGSPLKGGGYVK